MIQDAWPSLQMAPMHSPASSSERYRWQTPLHTVRVHYGGRSTHGSPNPSYQESCWFMFLSTPTQSPNHHNDTQNPGYYSYNQSKCLPLYLPLSTFLFLIFSRLGEPLPGFPLWCFVAGLVIKLRLRRPRELGDRALRMAA